ncbi:MAG: asparagine synthase C-terminal domain-containing protein [Myxococcota bacterium]
MQVSDQGLSAEGTADHVVEAPDFTAWIDGWTPAGPEALARSLVERGLASIADWPGDWAVALKRHGRAGLVVAVDPFGGRVLYTDGTTVASAPEHVTDLRTRPLDPAGIEAQLTGLLGDPTRTLVRGVTRVPGGFGGTTGERGVIARIWLPRPLPVERPALELRAAVEGAVRDRVAQHRERPVLALSGGLDSSVLAGVLAGHGPLGVVSNRFDGWTADEGPYIRAVAERHRLQPVPVDSRTLDPLEVLDRLAPPGFPPVLVNHHLNLALLRAADGPLWTGFGGDEVFGHGLDLVTELARDGRSLRAAWEAAWLARRYRHAEMSQARALRSWGARWVRAMLPDRAQIRRPDRPRGAFQRRVETVTHPLILRSREEQARLAALVGTPMVMPLLDPRVAAVCLGIPSRRMVRRGRTRWVVREAFADVLPPEVHRRPDKSDLSRGLDEPLRSATLDLRLDLLAPWRSARQIASLRQRFRSGEHGAAADLFRLVGASRWLEWHTGAEGIG